MVVLIFLFSLARFSADKLEILQGGVRVLQGDVRIEDDGTVIRAENATLYEREDMAVISDEVKIHTKRADIFTDTAYYYFKEQKTLLKGRVRIHSDSVEINTPLVWFFNKENRAKTDSLITITDKKGVRVLGRRGVYDFNKEKGWLYENPKLIIEKEKVQVTSKEMEIDNREGVASGIGDVELKSEKTALRCDTILFYTHKNTGIALGNPYLLDGDNRVKGDSVCFFIKDNRLESLKISGNVKAIYFTSEGDRIEIEGGEMGLYFKEERLDRIDITNHSVGVLYRRVDETKR